MENKELNEFRDTKPHQSKEKLSELWKSGKEVSEIANLLNISTKLVHIKLKEYGLI